LHKSTLKRVESRPERGMNDFIWGVRTQGRHLCEAGNNELIDYGSAQVEELDLHWM